MGALGLGMGVVVVVVGVLRGLCVVVFMRSVFQKKKSLCTLEEYNRH